jgi:hypothetical protein
MESKAFEEFVQKRCEEIIAEDKECNAINKKILNIEKELMPLLPVELKNKLLEIDRLSLALVNRVCAITTDKITTNR